LLAAGVAAGDVMVVAPYNAQVNLLRERLPEAVRVGTVDKFQGQEAKVLLYSLASSSADDVPHGLEFLLSRNRLNVAISRAQCLAYLVASPRLLEVNCRTIDQMRLANALCRFVELAG
jgi:superfamily I DNA and/or RNA helicase